MEITRAHFVDHFNIALRVQCLKAWPTRRRTKRQKAMGAPLYLATDVVKWLRTANGQLEGPPAAFEAPVRGVIDRLFDELPYGTAPEAEAFTGAVYDALVAAGLRLTIGPPLNTVRPVNFGPRVIPVP